MSKTYDTQLSLSLFRTHRLSALARERRIAALAHTHAHTRARNLVDEYVTNKLNDHSADEDVLNELSRARNGLRDEDAFPVD